MIEFTDLLDWLVRTLMVGGGLLLLASVAFAMVRQPNRRRAIASWAVRAALLVPFLTLAPSWLRISMPESVAETPIAVAADAKPAAPPVTSEPKKVTPSAPATSPVPESTPPSLKPEECYIFFLPIPSAPAATTAQPVAPPKSTEPLPVPPVADAVAPALPPIPVARLFLAIYNLLAAFFLGRWLIGHVALWRMLRSSRPAGKPLTRIFNDLARGWRVPPELRVARNLRGPVCCGLRRQVVLLPQRLAETGDEQSLRLVFAHELAHLERGDSWTGCWFGLAQALYFPMPWFWWLRRQVSLCQEYLADAAATRLCGPADYAAFLLDLSRSTRPGRHSPAVAGVIGNSSDLFRRVTMLLNSNRRVDDGRPWRWSLLAAGAFLSLAVLLSGVGFSQGATARPDDQPKAEAKDDIPLKPEKKPKADDAQPPQNQQDFDKHIQKMMEEMQRRMAQQDAQIKKMVEEMQKRMQQGGFGGVGVLPPGNFGPAFGGNAFRFGGLRGSGRLGAMVEKPSAALVEQLDLPKDQGIVLTEVKTDSAAAKAGLKANDILLELNGKPVASDPQEFRKQLASIKADQSVDAVVLRKGKRESVKGLKMPEAKPEDERGFGNFGPGIVIGPDGLKIDGKMLPIPAIPNIAELVPPVAIPPIPPGGNAFGGAGANKTLSISINNDRFTIHSRDDALNINVSGKLEDGKAVMESATITDGGKKVTADSMDKVPEKYRDAVKKLLENIKGGK
jgi:beta-lactamase regulating signal transducer with metallopeptidase domain/membrane-associated protease RseP (regulator of RpoE activity)